MQTKKLKINNAKAKNIPILGGISVDSHPGSFLLFCSQEQ
jgi:hypothetical protein